MHYRQSLARTPVKTARRLAGAMGAHRIVRAKMKIAVGISLRRKRLPRELTSGGAKAALKQADDLAPDVSAQGLLWARSALFCENKALFQSFSHKGWIGMAALFLQYAVRAAFGAPALTR